VRTRVHEYGGGAALATESALYYVDQADQRLYRAGLPGGSPPVPLTVPSTDHRQVRYADGVLDRSGRWFICVEESIGGTGTTHRLSAVPTDGSARPVVLVGDHDFVSSPRLSPDGSRLAWVTWDHPDMSWDVSELWVGRFSEREGLPVLTGSHRVSGDAPVSVGQPLWCADGGLLSMIDRTGWWLPHRIDAGHVDRTDPPSPPLVETESEFHAPDWVLGQATMVELPDGSVLARQHLDGLDRLVRLSPLPTGSTPASPWSIEPVDQPCLTIAGVARVPSTDRVAVLGNTADERAVVLELPLGTGPALRRLSAGRRAAPPVARASGAGPLRLEVMTASGAVPGLLHLPRGRTGRIGPPPPLVVFCHGGPTGSCEAGFDPVVRFFTDRGIAIAGVDYRGSSGYGRAYRRALRGQWGVADVDDCIGYATGLAELGWVDGGRMAIRGTSSGGLTALGALVRSDRFLGAASWYGVTDLESLAAGTHEFESRYLDGLIGPLPAAIDTYRQRSPLHQVDRMNGEVLVLQGTVDPVVPVSQARMLVDGLRRQGISHRLIEFEGESHGFRRASTVEACLTAELAFYRSLFGPERLPEGPVAVL
jgi:dipeptidyl aminopeptidase/acylaminoacyl peptidase